MSLTLPNSGRQTSSGRYVAPVTLLSQTALQPEAIGVLVVLGVALASLIVVATAWVRARRQRRARETQRRADQPDPTRFEGQAEERVIAAADRALYERDGRTLAAAALRLHEVRDPQALPYLLHALRAAPPHQREILLQAAVGHGPDELAEHPLLAAALPNEVLDELRDRLADAATSGRTVPSPREGRRR